MKSLMLIANVLAAVFALCVFAYGVYYMKRKKQIRSEIILGSFLSLAVSAYFILKIVYRFLTSRMYENGTAFSGTATVTLIQKNIHTVILASIAIFCIYKIFFRDRSQK